MIKFLRISVSLVVSASLFCSVGPASGQEHKAASSASTNISKPATAQARKQVKMLDGLLIKHWSWLGGDVDIAVTPEFLCISSPTRSDVFVSRAPFKTVIAYDFAKKTYYETKPEAAGSFMIQRFLKLLGGDPHPKKWKKVEERIIAGVKAGRYVVDSSSGPVKQSNEKGEKVIAEMRTCGFWAAENLNVPPGAADIVLKMEGFPTIHKLPLLFEKSKVDPHLRAKVSTHSVTKATFPPEKFQVPSGYRKAVAEYSLQGDELELFGGIEPTGSGKGKK